MINLGKDFIRNIIIDLLSDGSRKIVDLVEDVKEVRTGTTKQAVYLALRNLIREEIVVKYSKKVMLNQIWVNQLNEFALRVDKNYLESYRQKPKNELDGMAEGDRIIYSFKKLDSFDVFWNHIFSMIVKKTNRLAPLYLYNPHEWTALIREKSEKYMYEWIKRKKPKTFYAIGGGNHLDVAMRKKYSSESIEFSTGERMGFESNYYLAILENYLIETFLEKKLADKIDTIYSKFKNEKEASEKIRNIFNEKSKFKIIVSVNSSEASKIKKKFEKIFFVSKDIRNL
jgi:hypothetical protein